MSKLTDALAELNKGRKAPMVGDYQTVPTGHGAIPTGIITLDRHLKGGLPRGRFTHLYGHKSAGKSTLALLTARHAQRLEPDKAVVYIDTENAVDFAYAEVLGVDLSPERFLYAAPDDAEDAMLVASKLVRTGEVSLLVLDSVTGMISERRLENDPGKGMPAITAALMSEFCQRLARVQSATNTATLVLNHLTGTMKTDFHGNAIEVPRGGRAMPNWASVELLIKRVPKPVVEGGEAVASETTIRIEKNKVGLPFRETVLPMVFGHGFDPFVDAGMAAIETGLVEVKGAFYSVGGQKFQGKQKFFDAIAAKPQVIELIRGAVLDGVAFEWPEG